MVMFHGKIYLLVFSFRGVAKRDVCITDRALWGGNNTSGNRDTYNNSWRPDRTNAKYHMYGRT